MVIGQLGGWFKDLLGDNPLANVPHRPEPPQIPISEMPQQPQTIQRGAPLPSFQPQPGGYSVQGLQPGASTFARAQGLGPLLHPMSGPVYFDPTGRASSGSPPFPGNYLAMPMTQLDYAPMPHMQPIGGRYARN